MLSKTPARFSASSFAGSSTDGGKKNNGHPKVAAACLHRQFHAQWNCSSSVEPVSAVTLDLPP